MRKFNAILGPVILAFFLLHIIIGSLQLTGLTPGGNTVMQIGAWLLIAAVGAHTVIGIKLTVDTLAAIKRSGASYFRENKLFWIRRISGFAVMLFIAAHIILFMGHGSGGAFRLNVFDVPQFIMSVLLVLSVLLHIVTNIRPLMIALGSRSAKEFIADIAVVFSVLLLFSGIAFVVYFVRWLL